MTGQELFSQVKNAIPHLVSLPAWEDCTEKTRAMYSFIASLQGMVIRADDLYARCVQAGVLVGTKPFYQHSRRMVSTFEYLSRAISAHHESGASGM